MGGLPGSWPRRCCLGAEFRRHFNAPGRGGHPSGWVRQIYRPAPGCMNRRHRRITAGQQAIGAASALFTHTHTLGAWSSLNAAHAALDLDQTRLEQSAKET